MAERRRLVASLYLNSHLDQEQIAQRLQVHQSTISRDLSALKLIWRSEASADIQERLTRELLELDQMEAQVATQYEETHQMGLVGQRLEIKQHRAKLLGLFAPKRSDVSLGVSVMKIVDSETWNSI
jgi:hypothetical protein